MREATVKSVYEAVQEHSCRLQLLTYLLNIEMPVRKICKYSYKKFEKITNFLINVFEISFFY